MKKLFKSRAFWIALFLVFIALDIGTKWLAKTYLTNPLEILPGVFKLALSFNPGVAFSIPIPNAVMMILSPLLITILATVILKFCDISKNITKLSLVLILAGGLGNLINRFWTDSVIDFLSLKYWPSFNLADSFLTIAAFLLILFYGRIIAHGNK
ncbi:MAG: signal peptidase II [Patescibacteria group bacterium]